MAFEALIFDVDGTLADTEELHRQAFNHAFSQLQLGWVWDRALYRELLRTTGGKERITRYITQLALSPTDRTRALAQVAAIHEAKNRFYGEGVRSGSLSLRDGIERLLDEACAAGLKLAIATTTTADNVDALLTSTLGADGPDRFEVIACGDQVRHKKPAPDIYELALRTLGVEADRAIAFEDSCNGLIAATEAGLWTVVTPTFWTDGEDFAAAGLVLPNLGQVTLDELERLAMPARPNVPGWQPGASR